MLERSAAHMAGRIWNAFNHRERFFLAAVSGGCVALFLLLSHLMGWPIYPKQEASLLASASPVTGIAVVGVGLILSVLAASLLLGHLRYEAGLFAACIGLAGLAARGGPVGSLLRAAGRPQVYLAMLMETVMLLGMMGLAWTQLALLRRSGWLAPDPRDPDNELAATPVTRVLAALAQAVVTGMLVMLLARSDNQKQAMAAVALASLIGSIVAHQAFPVRPSGAFWVGPFLVAMIGYAWAIKSPGSWEIGTPANALAAASPLHYASLGTAGGIFGYWVSRQWREAEVEPTLPADALDG
jgi:hypothetical protein